ncbi:UDP-glucose 4-epimerase GalE [Agrococcus casei]|uniref:UDP-glucose 4-epimerase GalE n=1 Tax=Agrococcus casei TaxID=343512 RepID=UPI003F953442
MLQNETVLVTGGAGYIGSHVVRRLMDSGSSVVVVDDFSTGRSDRLDLPVSSLNLADPACVAPLTHLMERSDVSGVIHFAAKKRVDESVAEPVRYWRENVGGITNLLEAVAAAGVSRFVFSSSAAVYGDVRVASVSESVETRPMNPYGETKLAGECLLRAQSEATDLRAVSLRYFNVVGSMSDALSDTFPHNLFGQTFRRLDLGHAPSIFGADYPTPDGTCVRDYIHVDDLAQAHVAALAALRKPKPLLPAYNLGTGVGYSVREVLDTIRQFADSKREPELQQRRPGDPASVVADPTAAERDLGWKAAKGLEDMVATAVSGWRYRRA